MKKDVIDNVMDNPVYDKSYYDKRDPEEESLFDFEEDVQKRFEKLEKIYFKIVPEDTIENAKGESMKERIRMGEKENDNFVYGEMTFRSMSYLYETIKKSFGQNSVNKGNFYDLGSGHGHVLVQAAMIHPFNTCVGMEILNPLHKMALKTKINYDKEIKSAIADNPNLFPLHQGIAPNFKAINGSFFDHDWSNGSMVFTNSTCFSKEIMDEIFVKANHLPRGAFFINTTQKMPKKYLQHWQFITPFHRLMSWGVAKLLIYRKK